jgi:hypothetical protein
MSSRLDPSARKRPTSFTLRPDLLARLDEAAARLDRSRNWTAEHAITTFLETTTSIWQASSADTPAGSEPLRAHACAPARAPGRILKPAESHAAGLSRDPGQSFYRDERMDDPVTATRRFQHDHVDKVLRHEAAKRQSSAQAQDAAIERTLKDNTDV